MNARLHTTSIAQPDTEISAIIEQVDGNLFFVVSNEATHLIAQEFGYKGNEADAVAWLNENDGKEIEVEADYFAGCPQLGNKERREPWLVSA